MATAKKKPKVGKKLAAKYREELDDKLLRVSQYMECLTRELPDLDDNDPESLNEIAHRLEGLGDAASEAADIAGALEAALGYAEANRP